MAYKKYLTYALSNFDFDKLLPEVNFFTYEELTDDLDSMLGKKRAFILLYLTKERSGHYTCVFERKKGLISFFDSMGLHPDSELNFIDKTQRINNDEVYPKLFEIFNKYKQKYKFEYNNFPFQEKNTSTCGDHCYVRLLNRKYSPDDYKKSIDEAIKRTKLPNADNVVAYIVYSKLK